MPFRLNGPRLAWDRFLELVELKRLLPSMSPPVVRPFLSWRRVLLGGAGLLALGVLYFAYEEKTLPEYWLQRHLADAPLQAAVSLPADSVLRYAFYDSSGIDLAVEVDNAGALRVTQGAWFDDHPWMLRTRTTVVDPATFRSLARRFARTWPTSRMDDVDNHFGGRYALLELRHDSAHAVTVGYYNVVPAAPFSQFKRELLKLAERAR